MGGRGRCTGYANYFRDYKRLGPIPKLATSKGERPSVNIKRRCRVITKKITEADTEERRQGVMLAVRNGSVVTWQHINLHGEYDFADEKLQDSIRLHASVILAANVLGQWEALVSLTR